MGTVDSEMFVRTYFLLILGNSLPCKFKVLANDKRKDSYLT